MGKSILTRNPKPDADADADADARRSFGWAWLAPVLLAAGPFSAGAYVQQHDDNALPLRINFSQNPTWTYHLGTSGSVRGVLSNEWTNVRAAVGQWLAVPGTTLKFVEGATIASVAQIPVEDARIDILWADPGVPYPLGVDFGGGQISISTSQVAVTYLFTDPVNTSVILQAIVLVRRDLDYVTSYTAFSSSQPFLETAMLHEFGHILGANHSPLGIATLWWNSGGGANAAAGLSADEVAFAQGVYGTASMNSTRGRISGTVRLNGAAVLGAMVLAERTNGILVSATVTRKTGAYDFAGLPPGVYQLRVAPMDPSGPDSTTLVQGSHLDITSRAEYALATTAFQPTAPVTITLTAKTPITRDFSVSSATTAPLRISGIRQGFNPDDLASAGLPLQLGPGQSQKWIGVYVPGLDRTDVTLRLSGTGLTYGSTVVLTNNTLRNIPLVQVPVSVETDAPAGPRTLELTVSSVVVRANGFVEILPPYPDDNFDGFDDLFQRSYWAPFTVAAAAPGADPDGDGYTNQREAAAGTSPLSPSSFPFQATATLKNGKIIVTETVVAGQKYQLYARDSLATDWVAVGGIVTAKGDLQEFADDRPLQTERYYRVRRL